MGRYPRRQHTWTDGRGAGPGRLQPAGVRTIGEQLRGHLPLPAADHQQQVTVDAVAVLAQVRRDFQSGEVKLHLGDESKKLTYAQRRELATTEEARTSSMSPSKRSPLTTWCPMSSPHRSAIGATADDASALRARSLLRRDGKLTQAAALL